MIIFETDTDVEKLSWRDQHRVSRVESNGWTAQGVAERLKGKQVNYVEDNLPAESQVHFHKNYVEYLEECWGTHAAVVLTPDHVWYSLLCEVAALVAKEPEKNRALFTTSAEKVKIVVDIEDSNTVLPLEAITRELRSRVPGKVTELMTEDFTTTTVRSRMARLAAFADMVSPYYDYGMKLCGIPRLRLEGTYEDWDGLATRWLAVGEMFSEHAAYFNRVQEILGRLVSQFESPDAEFMRGIFRIESCGSGHETLCRGWFTDLFHAKPSPAYSKNFPTHASTVSYQNLVTKRNYEMKQGLFFSRREDEFLVPDYGHVVYEKVG